MPHMSRSTALERSNKCYSSLLHEQGLVSSLWLSLPFFLQPQFSTHSQFLSTSTSSLPTLNFSLFLPVPPFTANSITATAATLPLPLVMALSWVLVSGSARVHPAYDVKKSGASHLLGQCLQEADLCLGSNMWWLSYSFLKVCME